MMFKSMVLCATTRDRHERVSATVPAPLWLRNAKKALGSEQGSAPDGGLMCAAFGLRHFSPLEPHFPFYG